MQKGNYNQAIKSYRLFISNYKSENFKKDSYFKISLCYWLQGRSTEAYKYYEIARKTGKEVAEPDRYASAQLKENEFPEPRLLKIRLFTDGGYFNDALQIFKSFEVSELKTQKERVEYYYRKARLADKMGDIETAQINYEKTLNLSGENPWYFAPNSALQLGYMAKTKNDTAAAKKYFLQALNYKKHEYKNSIDGKAKSALEELNN